MDTWPHGGFAIISRRDVAEKAGVSFAVVSRVLNNSGYVAQEKRERVLQVAKELNYNPHPVAVSLKNNKTHQILYYVRDLSNNYYMEMYKGMVAYAGKRGYNFLLSGHFDYQQINSLMVDGVILPNGHYTSSEFIENIRIPVVAAGYSNPINEATPHVDADVIGAVRLAVDHLRSLGHTRIAYITENLTWINDPRKQSFIEATEGLWGPGVPAPLFGPKYDREPEDEVNYFEAGITAAGQFLAGDRKATGVVCFNDDEAIGFMGHLQSQGWSIPRDLSVVGIDGHFGGEYTFPPVTTISIEPHKHGAECARMLIDILEGGVFQGPFTIPCRLVVRQSTGPVRSS